MPHSLTFKFTQNYHSDDDGSRNTQGSIVANNVLQKEIYAQLEQSRKLDINDLGEERPLVDDERGVSLSTYAMLLAKIADQTKTHALRAGQDIVNPLNAQGIEKINNSFIPLEKAIQKATRNMMNLMEKDGYLNCNEKNISEFRVFQNKLISLYQNEFKEIAQAAEKINPETAELFWEIQRNFLSQMSSHVIGKTKNNATHEAEPWAPGTSKNHIQGVKVGGGAAVTGSLGQLQLTGGYGHERISNVGYHPTDQTVIATNSRRHYGFFAAGPTPNSLPYSNPSNPTLLHAGLTANGEVGRTHFEGTQVTNKNHHLNKLNQLVEGDGKDHITKSSSTLEFFRSLFAENNEYGLDPFFYGIGKKIEKGINENSISRMLSNIGFYKPADLHKINGHRTNKYRTDFDNFVNEGKNLTPAIRIATLEGDTTDIKGSLGFKLGPANMWRDTNKYGMDHGDATGFTFGGSGSNTDITYEYRNNPFDYQKEKGFFESTELMRQNSSIREQSIAICGDILESRFPSAIRKCNDCIRNTFVQLSSDMSEISSLASRSTAKKGSPENRTEELASKIQDLIKNNPHIFDEKLAASEAFKEDVMKDPDLLKDYVVCSAMHYLKELETLFDGKKTSQENLKHILNGASKFLIENIFAPSNPGGQPAIETYRHRLVKVKNGEKHLEQMAASVNAGVNPAGPRVFNEAIRIYPNIAHLNVSAGLLSESNHPYPARNGTVMSLRLNVGGSAINTLIIGKEVLNLAAKASAVVFSEENSSSLYKALPDNIKNRHSIADVATAMTAYFASIYSSSVAINPVPLTDSASGLKYTDPSLAIGTRMISGPGGGHSASIALNFILEEDRNGKLSCREHTSMATTTTTTSISANLGNIPSAFIQAASPGVGPAFELSVYSRAENTKLLGSNYNAHSYEANVSIARDLDLGADENLSDVEVNDWIRGIANWRGPAETNPIHRIRNFGSCLEHMRREDLHTLGLGKKLNEWSNDPNKATKIFEHVNGLNFNVFNNFESAMGKIKNVEDLEKLKTLGLNFNPDDDDPRKGWNEDEKNAVVTVVNAWNYLAHDMNKNIIPPFRERNDIKMKYHGPQFDETRWIDSSSSVTPSVSIGSSSNPHLYL